MGEIENKAGSDLPDHYDRKPPQDYEGDMDTPLVEESQMSLQAQTAKKVGSILANLKKSELDMLYEALSPLTKKLGWYDSRYAQMQKRISYLSNELKEVTKQNIKLRSRVTELGGKVG
jgi:chromosome segregation ATPase